MDVISLDFNSQNIVNTLWVFATMGTMPGGQRMIGQLEWRAEAITGEFTSQDIANTLWAFATMKRKPGDQMMGKLERKEKDVKAGPYSHQLEDSVGHGNDKIGETLRRRATATKGTLESIDASGGDSTDDMTPCVVTGSKVANSHEHVTRLASVYPPETRVLSILANY